MQTSKTRRTSAFRSSRNPDRSWQGRSFVIPSLDEALATFLGTPAGHPNGVEGYLVDAIDAAGRGWTNGDVINLVCGSAGVAVRDPALYDGASGRHGQKCETFVEAFRACAVPYDRRGHRDWRDLDMDTLRGLHPAFRALQRPEWVEAALCDMAAAEFYAAVGELAAEIEAGDDLGPGAYDADVDDVPAEVAIVPQAARPAPVPPPVPAAPALPTADRTEAIRQAKHYLRASRDAYRSALGCVADRNAAGARNLFQATGKCAGYALGAMADAGLGATDEQAALLVKIDTALRELRAASSQGLLALRARKGKTLADPSS